MCRAKSESYLRLAWHGRCSKVGADKERGAEICGMDLASGPILLPRILDGLLTRSNPIDHVFLQVSP